MLLARLTRSCWFIWLVLASTNNPTVRGPSAAGERESMVCGTPASSNVKSPIARSRTISPVLLRTVTKMLTASPVGEDAGSCPDTLRIPIPAARSAQAWRRVIGSPSGEDGRQ